MNRGLTTMLRTLLPINFEDTFSFDNFKDLLSKDTIKTDVQELDDNYKIEMDLPGYKKEDVKLKLDGGRLIVSAQKETEEDTSTRKYICKERSSSYVERSFNLGTSVDESKISASMEDGVLIIEFPKKEPSEMEENTIEIK